jgi:microcompartment protein CcmL/EutN
MVTDLMLKAANVTLLGLEPIGDERVLIRLSGQGPADLEAAAALGIREARRMGVEAMGTVIPSPAPDIRRLNSGPVAINGLYGAREEMRPEPLTMKTNNKAIGILETQGLAAILEGTDTMLKAADVRLVGKEKIGAAYVTIIIEGDVAAVKAAVEAGAQAVGNLGKLIAAHVIARPHDDLARIMPTT